MLSPQITLKDSRARGPFSRQGSGGILLVTEGIAAGASFNVQDAALIVGSGEEAQCRIKDPCISRRHLCATPQGVGLVLEDLNSTNGSFVHEVRFEKILIQFGTEIRIGNSVFKYVPVQEPLDVSAGDAYRYGAMIGKSEQMRRLFRILDQVAGESLTVLINGETGTGKELVAREIHEHSPRKDKPFVVLDCASIPRELIESALFGHIRGSFTGATSDRIGVFEQANGGTIFLDEIGELPLEMQPSLLRVLESRSFTPIGSTQLRKVDVRVVAATNRDLATQVDEGNFREDLYYRLAVVSVSVPPLRERIEDIPLLTEEFMKQFSISPAKLDPKLSKLFSEHDWPGNVRELRNAVERLRILSSDVNPIQKRKALNKVTIPTQILQHKHYKTARREALREFERLFIANLLERHNNNLETAADDAGVNRRLVRELAVKYGLLPKRQTGF